MTSSRVPEPARGDAFGHALLAAADDHETVVVMEHDDVWSSSIPSGRNYFDGPEDME